MIPTSAPPSLLFKRLNEITGKNFIIKPQKFRGFKNPGQLCYSISFFQLFFHCKFVRKYLRKQNIKNHTEILLGKILSDLSEKNDNESIEFTNFIENWNRWDGDQPLPLVQTDCSEFYQQIFKSVSLQLQNFFLIDFRSSRDYLVDGEKVKQCLINIKVKYGNVQFGINHATKYWTEVKKLPKYLFICINRSHTTFLTNVVKINSYIDVFNSHYKFLGSTVFNGNDQHGHYTSIIKVENNYFYFDDGNVYSLFYTKHCSKYTQNLICICNKLLKENSTLLVYEAHNGEVDTNLFEEIKYEVSQATTQTTLMFNTLQQIRKGSKKGQKQSNSKQMTKKKALKSTKGKKQTKSNKTLKIARPLSVGRMSISSQNSPKYRKNSENNIFTNSRTLSVQKHPNLNLQDNSLNLSTNEDFPLSDYFASDEEMFSNLTGVDLFGKTEDLDTSQEEAIKENVQIYHSILPRESVDVEDLEDNNGLHGVININRTGIPAHQEKRKDSSIYSKYRQLFQYTGRILRYLDYVDQGAINADILSKKLHIHTEEDDAIAQQGMKLYSILKRIIDRGKFDFNLVKKNLEPICIWYTNKYKHYWRDQLLDRIIIHDDINEMRKDLDVTNNQPIDKDELNDLIEYFINEINSDDDDGNYFDPESGFEIDEQIIPQKVVIEEEQSETESESFDTSSVEFHLAGTLKYLKDPSQYMPDIDDDYDFDDDADDNQITLGSYYWQERCEINNIDEIVDRIRAEIDKKKQNKKNS